MKDIYQELPLIDNKERHFFEMHVEGHVAFIHYKKTPAHVILIHTEVPEALEGRGIAGALVEKTLLYLEEQGLKIVPSCQYVQAFLKRHPEWNRMVDKEY